MKRTIAITMIAWNLTLSGIWAEEQRKAKPAQLVETGSGVRAEEESRETEFRPEGPRMLLRSTSSRFGFQLKEVRAGEQALPSALERHQYRPAKAGETVAYPRSGGVQESYRVVPGGLAQTFALDPGIDAGASKVQIVGEIDGSLSGEAGRYVGSATFLSAGQPSLSYGPARAIDAAGNEVPVEIGIEANRLTLEVSGSWLRSAQHPVRIESQIVEPKAFSLLPTKTHLPPSENMPVWRVQIRLETATNDNSGTDDNIQVKLNSTNGTWLNYARNDFERGDVFYYDLSLAGITRLGDISMINIRKGGTDGWGLRSVALYVNGGCIYASDLSGGRWFDSSPTDTRNFVISTTTLRSNMNWALLYSAPAAPYTIYASELKSLAESNHGNVMKSYEDAGFVWGGEGQAWVGRILTDTSRTMFGLSYKKVRQFNFDEEITQIGALHISCQSSITFPTIRMAAMVGSSDDSFARASFANLGVELQSKLNAIIRAANTGNSCPQFSMLSDGGILIVR